MQLPTTKAHCAELAPQRCTICMEAFADGGPASSPPLGGARQQALGVPLGEHQ